MNISQQNLLQQKYAGISVEEMESALGLDPIQPIYLYSNDLLEGEDQNDFEDWYKEELINLYDQHYTEANSGSTEC